VAPGVDEVKHSAHRRSLLRRALALAALATAGALRAGRLAGEQLGSGLRALAGRVVARGDPDYRRWWQSMVWYVLKPPRYPDAIVRAADDAEVLRTVAHARDTGLKLSVRSSGHNPARSVLRDGGLLLDLGAFSDIRIDPGRRTAWVGAGVRSASLATAAARHGLAFPGAHTPMVGLGGYLLGGGLGWNMPAVGIACRSMIGAELVTAAGEQLTVSRSQHPELLWALRGVGPGCFAAVMRYELQLYPMPRAINKSRYVIASDDLALALEMLGQAAAAKQDRLEILATVGRFHPLDKPWAERELVLEVKAVAFGDSRAEADALLQPLAATGLPALSIDRQEGRPQAYESLYAGQSSTDQTSPWRTAVENLWTEDPGAVIASLAAKLERDPPVSPRSFLLSAWGFNNQFEDPHACIRTAAPHYVSWYLLADQESDIGPNRIWMDEAVAGVAPLARGRYINEIDPVHYPHHVQECFAPASWERLQALRRQYDGDGVFHSYIGQSATPAPAASPASSG